MNIEEGLRNVDKSGLEAGNKAVLIKKRNDITY